MKLRKPKREQFSAWIEWREALDRWEGKIAEKVSEANMREWEKRGASGGRPYLRHWVSRGTSTN